jgi:anion-transporting  ArsA/GET3 family ATPase
MAREERVIDPQEAESPVQVWAQYPELTESKLFHEYINRLVEGRHLIVYITAAAETGVGKTTLALLLALFWDQHGWDTDKATLSAKEYSMKYDEVGPGSAMILDEAEQDVSNMRSMTKSNKAVTDDLAGKRYKQVFTIMTLPNKGSLDKRIRDQLADYWIQCQATDDGKALGEAKVYRLHTDEHYEQDYNKFYETISFPDISDHPLKNELDDIKQSDQEGVAEQRYMERSEHEEVLENEIAELTTEIRNEVIKTLGDDYQWTQFAERLSDVAHFDELAPQTVSRIARGKL